MTCINLQNVHKCLSPNDERLISLGDVEIINKDGSVIRKDSLKLDACSLNIYDLTTGKVDEDLSKKIQRIDIVSDRGSVTFGNPPEDVQIKLSVPILNSDWKTYPEADLNMRNFEAAGELINGWLREMGIEEGSHYWKKMKFGEVPFLTAAHSPGVLMQDEYPILLLMFAFLVLDDTLDNYKDFWNTGVSTLEMIQVVDSLCSICLGEEYDESLEKRTTFPHYPSLCRFFKEFRKCAEDAGLERFEELIKGVLDCLETNAWENQGWSGLDNTEVDGRQVKWFYFFRRESTYGWLVLLDSNCVYQNVRISSLTIRDPLLQLIRRRWVRTCIIVNDVFSLRKEISNGEMSNSLFVRGNKMSGSAALKKTLNELDWRIQDILTIEKKLLRKYKNSEDFEPLQEYLKIGKVLCDANHKYMLLAGRYGNEYEFLARAYM